MAGFNQLTGKKTVVEGFLRCKALSPETAKTPQEAGAPAQAGFTIERLKAIGVLKPVEAGRFYVDAAALAHDKRRSRATAVMLFGAVLAIALGIAAFVTPLPMWLMGSGAVTAVILLAVGTPLSRR